MNTFLGLFRKPAPPVKVHHQAPRPEPDVEVEPARPVEVQLPAPEPDVEVQVEPAPPVKVQLPAPEPDVEVHELEPAPPVKVQLPAPEPDVVVHEREPARPVKVQLPALEPEVEVHEVDHEPAQGPNVIHVAVDFQRPDQPKPKFSSSIFKFHQPSFREEDFELLVKRNRVSLEFCLWNEDSISGFVSVANLGFQKAVFVRATANRWKSYEDIPAEFLSSDAELERDRFNFSLPFDRNLEFAIAYRVNGITFWDNNEGSNYFITVT